MVYPSPHHRLHTQGTNGAKQGRHTKARHTAVPHNITRNRVGLRGQIKRGQLRAGITERVKHAGVHLF